MGRGEFGEAVSGAQTPEPPVEVRPSSRPGPQRAACCRRCRWRVRSRHVAVAAAALCIQLQVLAAEVPPSAAIQDLGTLQAGKRPAAPAAPSAAPEASPPKDSLKTLKLPKKLVELRLETPVLREPIYALLAPLLGKQEIAQAQLSQIQAQIWLLGQKDGALLQTSFAVADTGPDDGVALKVIVKPVVLRKISVGARSSAAPDAEALENLSREVLAIAAEGVPVDTRQLDGYLLRRNRVGDVVLSGSFVNAGPTELDLRLAAEVASAGKPTALMRLDNSGASTYGRNRLLVSAASGDLVAPVGVELLGLATVDSKYLRTTLSRPVTTLASRVSGWGSYMQANSAIGTKTRTGQLAGQLDRPLWASTDSQLDGLAQLTHTSQTTRTAEGLMTSDQSTTDVRLGLDYGATRDALRWYAGAALTSGRLSLSDSQQTQDAVGAQMGGAFAKLEYRAGVSLAELGPERRASLGASLRGQVANKNLDGSEKFSLGGAGEGNVRGYANYEASGDQGWVAGTSASYRLTPELVALAFLDIGHITRNKRPWQGDKSTAPQSYLLKSGGVQLLASYGQASASLTVARQLGANPGLDSRGLDVEGSSSRWRVWMNLDYRF